MHALGYVAPTAREAADEFFPGYARAFSKIGKERGWPAVSRADFDALLGPHGALLVGDPETVVAKILRHSEALGGISRMSFQMSVADLPHTRLMRSIELLGTRVAPAVRAADGGRVLLSALREGPELKIQITDDGPEVGDRSRDPEILEAATLVGSQGGLLLVETRADRGTTVTIRLPSPEEGQDVEQRMAAQRMKQPVG